MQKLRGHYQYYGITGNSRALSHFAHQVEHVWRKWLNQRSERAKMTWERMDKLLKRYPLPLPKSERLAKLNGCDVSCCPKCSGALIQLPLARAPPEMAA